MKTFPLIKNIEDQQKTVNEIKSFHKKFDRKNIEEKYQTYKTISKEKEVKKNRRTRTFSNKKKNISLFNKRTKKQLFI